jgi:cell division protein FtsB
MREWQQIVLVMGILVAGLALTWFDSSDGQIYQLRTAVQSQLQANRAMRREIRELRGQIYDITHDDRYLEQLARNKLALSRDGEEVYLFNERKKEQDSGKEPAQQENGRKPGGK